MSHQEELTKNFQKCRKCGRWEPIQYLENEQKHKCPINKNMCIPVKFENGSHIYNDEEYIEGGCVQG